MQPVKSWKLRSFLEVSVSVWVISFLICQQVVAALKCYQCSVSTPSCKNTDNRKDDDCYDPKTRNKSLLRECEISEPCEQITCSKRFTYDDTCQYPGSMERSCAYTEKKATPACDSPNNFFDTWCYCNDRDGCNDDPGIGVTVEKYNFNGCRSVPGCTLGPAYCVAVSNCFRLPHAVLALLSGCFGIAPILGH